MNLVGIDTSTDMISIAMMIKDRLVLNFNRYRKHGASGVMSCLEGGLKKLSINLDIFDAFVVGAGPGSFTGLRISFSIIKALSLALKKPVIKIESFSASAHQFKNRFAKIATIADAKRNLIYGVTFRIRGSRLKKEKKESLYTLKDFVEKNKDYFFVTYNRFLRDELKKIDSSIRFSKRDVWPKAKNLLIIAKDYFQYKKFTPLDRLEPLYVYPKDCQVRKIES